MSNIQYPIANDFAGGTHRILSAEQGKILNNAIIVLNANIADNYDSTKTYAVGNYCIYNGQLYRCVTAITTAEAWTSAHWIETNILDENGNHINAEEIDDKLNIAIDTEINKIQIDSLRTNYVSDGSSWIETGIDPDFDNGDYIELEVDLSTVTGDRENIISVGSDIASWKPSQTGGNYHFYYTAGDNFINCAACDVNNAMHIAATVTPNSTCTIRIDSVGISVNNVRYIPKYGSRYYVDEVYNYETINANIQSYITSASSLEIGSSEGNNRSHATYNYIRIIRKLSGITNINKIQFNDILLDISTKVEQSDFNSLNNNVVKKDSSDQVIQNSSSGGSTTFRVRSTATTGAEVYIRADSEGGNVQVQKGNSIAELDSYALNDSGTGYARLYVTTNGANIKTFQFKQNGQFLDGNSRNLSLLSTTQNVGSSISLSSSKGTFSQKYAYRSGNVISLGFVFTASSAIGAGVDWGITANFSDTALKPIASRSFGGSNVATVLATIVPNTTNIDGGSATTAQCYANSSSAVSQGNAFWVMYNYICGG